MRTHHLALLFVCLGCSDGALDKQAPSPTDIRSNQTYSLRAPYTDNNSIRTQNSPWTSYDRAKGFKG